MVGVFGKYDRRRRSPFGLVLRVYETVRLDYETVPQPLDRVAAPHDVEEAAYSDPIIFPRLRRPFGAGDARAAFRSRIYGEFK